MYYWQYSRVWNAHFNIFMWRKWRYIIQVCTVFASWILSHAFSHVNDHSLSESKSETDNAKKNSRVETNLSFNKLSRSVSLNNLKVRDHNYSYGGRYTFGPTIGVSAAKFIIPENLFVHLYFFSPGLTNGTLRLVGTVIRLKDESPASLAASVLTS